MPRRSWMGLALLLGLQTSSAHADEFGAPHSWIQDNLQKALEEGRKTGKPVFVVFRCER